MSFELDKQEYESTLKNILNKIGAIEYCACGAVCRLTGKLDEEQTEKLASEQLKSMGLELDKQVLNKIIDETPYSNKCPKCESFDDWYFNLYLHRYVGEVFWLLFFKIFIFYHYL